jgi:hypothetical protein
MTADLAQTLGVLIALLIGVGVVVTRLMGKGGF